VPRGLVPVTAAEGVGAMSISHLKADKKKGLRNLPFKVKIARRRYGQKDIIKYFATRKEAELFEAAEKLKLVEKNSPGDVLKGNTVQRIVSEYLYDRNIAVREYLGQKAPLNEYMRQLKLSRESEANETWVLLKFMQHPLCNKALKDVDRYDGLEYIKYRERTKWRGPAGNWRVAKEITPRTIRKEASLLKRVFDHACRKREYQGLVNPFLREHIGEIEGSTKGQRERALRPGEFQAIEKACEKCQRGNQFFIPLAIWIAIDTGMREQEIFNLQWGDIFIQERRMVIRKSKTDKKQRYPGRVIPIPPLVLFRLLHLAVHLMHGYRVTEKGQLRKSLSWDQSGFDMDGFKRTPIFPFTKHAFKQAWRDLIERAGIKDDTDLYGRHIPKLNFHDLRREANTSYLGVLEEYERDHLSGRAYRNAKDLDKVYILPDKIMQDIQDKLDRHLFNGKTLAELENESIERKRDLTIQLMKQGMSEHQAIKVVMQHSQEKIMEGLARYGMLQLFPIYQQTPRECSD
jgi:integrase